MVGPMTLDDCLKSAKACDDFVLRNYYLNTALTLKADKKDLADLYFSWAMNTSDHSLTISYFEKAAEFGIKAKSVRQLEFAEAALKGDEAKFAQDYESARIRIKRSFNLLEKLEYYIK